MSNLTLGKPERWLPVSISSDYEVSDWGRIRHVSTGEIKDPTIGRNGAALINLRVGTTWSVRCVGVLVAEAFLGPRRRGYMVVHKDGDRTHTAASNLAYAPLGDRAPANVEERGRYLVGKLDAAKAKEIRDRARAGESGRRLAEEYQVSAPLVSAIKNGLKWAPKKRREVTERRRRG